MGKNISTLTSACSPPVKHSLALRRSARCLLDVKQRVLGDDPTGERYRLATLVSTTGPRRDERPTRCLKSLAPASYRSCPDTHGSIISPTARLIGWQVLCSLSTFCCRRVCCPSAQVPPCLLEPQWNIPSATDPYLHRCGMLRATHSLTVPQSLPLVGTEKRLNPSPNHCS